MRTATLHRATAETDVKLSLDLDGGEAASAPAWATSTTC